MRGRKHLSKKIEEKTPMPKNQTLLNFVKFSKDEKEIEKIKEPKIHVPKHVKIPNSSGQTFDSYPEDPFILYPKNPEFRDYQFQISMECIKYNTLVCLPTGLGKTHVASILIMNFTLWFPESKIFFLAPTRPLVRQQRQSLKWFYQKIGVQNVFEMNGQITGQKRKKFYESKKVFFATPQTFANDLKEGRINKQEIKLIIFDQAHRAVGNSAYAESIRFLNKHSKSLIRIIGLSATPGNQKDKIQEVIHNLNITKMMYKDEQQPDVKRYFFNKSVEPIIIDPPSIIQEAITILDEMVIPYLRFLISLKLADSWVLKSKINSGLFFVVFQSFNQRKTQLDSSNSQFAYSSLRIIKFLIDSKTDLLSHGYQTFKSKFFRQIESIVLQDTQQKNQGNEKEQSKKINQNSKNSKSVNLVNQSLPKKFKQKTVQSQGYKRIKELFNPKSNILNHPKLQKLRQILDEFFKKSFRRLPSGKLNDLQNEKKSTNSKCIVFTHHRSTAFEIKSYLSNSQIIHPELFHGQSKTKIYEDRYNDMGEYENSKQSVLVLNQKQQISIIDKFKNGDLNTLIATSIGEQGLDIGEVDCIVCYDGGNKSPIRSIQRFGRTGRKRDGVVFILLMKGNQENDYKKGKQKIKSMKKMLKQGEFDYYGYNVSLLKEQSQIPVVLYDNEMLQAPKTQKKQKRGRKKKQQLKDQSQSSEETSQEKQQIEEVTQDQIIQTKQNANSNVSDIHLSNSDFLEKLFQKQFQETYFDENPKNQQHLSTNIDLGYSEQIQKDKEVKQKTQTLIKKQKSTKKKTPSKKKKLQEKQIKSKQKIFDSGQKIKKSNQRQKSQKSNPRKSKYKPLKKQQLQKNQQKFIENSARQKNCQFIEKTQQNEQKNEANQNKIAENNEVENNQMIFSCEKKDRKKFYQRYAQRHIELSSNLMQHFQSLESLQQTQEAKILSSIFSQIEDQFVNLRQQNKRSDQCIKIDKRKELDLILEQFFQKQVSQDSQNQSYKHQLSKNSKQKQQFNIQSHLETENILKIDDKTKDKQSRLNERQKLLFDIFSSQSQNQNQSLNSSQILDQIITKNSNKTLF